MRKLEFRFWDKVNNEMWYQDELEMIIVDRDGFTPLYNSGAEFKSIEKTKNIFVMEYTGRLDINGFKVFQGDVLRVVDSYNPDREPFIGYVDYRDCSFIIKSECSTNYRWMDYDVEVVGNIFENSNLVELE